MEEETFEQAFNLDEDELWDGWEVREEPAQEPVQVSPYLFLESPPWPGELGPNYLYYLGIRPICRGFLPLARMVDACYQNGLP